MTIAGRPRSSRRADDAASYRSFLRSDPPDRTSAIALSEDIARTAKDAFKRLLRRLFEVGQRVGLDILPRHFYSQIPDVAELRRRHDWRTPHSMLGVPGAEVDEQLRFAADCCLPGLHEHSAARRRVYADACRANGAVGYGPAEAEFLYCFIGARRPRRVIQVGGGVSTAVMLTAAQDHGLALEVVCIDPFPTSFLVDAARRDAIVLLTQRAQDVRIETLTDLSAGDLLFIDSTHTVKPGSEVNRLILEVLPRLAQGVCVHFHDIWFPYDYAPSILHDDLFFWNESVMLHAFMAHNDRYTLRLAMSLVGEAAPSRLGELLPSYSPAARRDGLRLSARDLGHAPSAAYLEVTGA